MENYSNELKNQIKWIDALIDKTEKSLKLNEINDSRLVKISKKKNGYQYYLQDYEGKRKYVKQSDYYIIQRMMQRDYDEKVKKKLLTLRYRIDRFLKLYSIDEIEKVYTEMSDARKVMVEPVIMPDKDFVRNWIEEHKGEQNSFPEKGRYTTQNGEYVRSKSEKILADLFMKNGVPYIYEPAFQLFNGKIVYPDFVALNIKRRKTVYWEHFGLITDEGYASNAIKKLALYEKSGLEIGNNLLISSESEEMPLDIKMIEKKIRKALLS